MSVGGASTGTAASTPGDGKRLETVRFLTPKDFEMLAKSSKASSSVSAKAIKARKASAKVGPISEDVAEDVLVRTPFASLPPCRISQLTLIHRGGCGRCAQDAPVVYVDPLDLQGAAAKKRMRALERMKAAEVRLSPPRPSLFPAACCRDCVCVALGAGGQA